MFHVLFLGFPVTFVVPYGLVRVIGSVVVDFAKGRL